MLHGNTLVSFLLAPLVVNSLGSVYHTVYGPSLSQFTGYLWLFDFGVRESVVELVTVFSSVGGARQAGNKTVRPPSRCNALVSLSVLGVVGGFS